MTFVNPEKVRDCVRTIKVNFEEYQIPALKLPPDSLIESTVRKCADIIAYDEDGAWKHTLDLIPKECIVHSREGGGPEDFEASVAISIAKLSAKYLEMKEAIEYLTRKLHLPGYKRQELFDFFLGGQNIPGLKVAREIVQSHRKALKSMEPMITLDPAADAAFDRCEVSINAAIERKGLPSVSETI